MHRPACRDTTSCWSPFGNGLDMTKEDGRVAQPPHPHRPGPFRQLWIPHTRGAVEPCPFRRLLTAPSGSPLWETGEKRSRRNLYGVGRRNDPWLRPVCLPSGLIGKLSCTMAGSPIQEGFRDSRLKQSIRAHRSSHLRRKQLPGTGTGGTGMSMYCTQDKESNP